MPTTCDIYRPVGSPTPDEVGVECEAIERIGWGNSALNPTPNWTHEFVLPKGTKLKQATTFHNHVYYSWVESIADGLKVGDRKYVVCWVLRMDSGEVRAFCLRM